MTNRARGFAVAAAAVALLATPPAAFSQSGPATQPASPLSFHVGDASVALGGFMDATVITRSTNHGSGIGTSFGTIPFENTPQGHLSETRFSAQNSRLTLLAAGPLGDAAIRGYLEADFLGNAPNGLNVTSNSNTLRMRLFWAQYTRGRFEFLAGQSWSLMTPGRRGVSSMPGDLFYTQDVDTNYQMGLTWERTPQFRFVVHATDVVTAGLSIANPEQYVGTAVVLPAGFPPFEVSSGSVTVSTPNRYPDVVGKVALDPKTGRTRQHVEAAVLVRGFRSYNPGNATTFTATGTGVAAGAVIEPAPGVRIAATAFLSRGGGRYIANTNLPDFAVNVDGSLTLVQSRSFIVGPEVQVTSGTLVYGYYSEARADRAVDTDVNDAPIGFGIGGSTSANRRLQEATVGVTHTFFRDPRAGGMQLMVQWSNVRRTPFAAPANTPADAHLNMLYVNVRYTLP